MISADPNACKNYSLRLSSESKKSVDPKDIQPGSPIEMMSSAGVPEQSLTTGLFGIDSLLQRFHLSQYCLHYQVRKWIT